MRERVLLVGSYPPPYGGCSVHVMRLREALRDTFDLEVIDLYGTDTGDGDAAIVRCGGRRPLNAINAVLALMRRRARLVHFHVAGMNAFMYAAYPMLFALRRKTRTIVTIHSGSFIALFADGPRWRRAMLRDVLGRFTRIVTVNQEQRTYLEGLGVDGNKILVIPAFLPPVARESARARAALQRLAGYDRLVVSSGYGLEYYGFTYIADALESLHAESNRSALLLCLYNSYDESYVAALERRFARGLAGLVLRDLEPEEFAWILQRCDLYVRATDRDGDAVAVREALFYGKPVIASDCVERPPAVRLFTTNDSAALARLLANVDPTETPSECAGEPAGLAAILSIYDEALRA